MAKLILILLLSHPAPPPPGYLYVDVRGPQPDIGLTSGTVPMDPRGVVEAPRWFEGRVDTKKPGGGK